ncbi:MAG: ATP-dependent 6-phosphofructokinase [Anaerolineae bacterium]|nr:ATP-dependent 6-phosphofructokinase [Anaerolineae bacterium]
MTKRIGILTGGGDAPGLNAVIRSVVLTAYNAFGWEVVGIRQGFDGLLAGTPVMTLSPHNAYDLLARGGTVLGAVNRGNPFMRPVVQPDGTQIMVDAAQDVITRMHELNLDAMIAAGGAGTMAAALRLVELGARIVGVPKTIDNDLSATDVTFGFDTAVVTATEALDKLQTTAESHHRVMVLEVMGRDAGWIALTTGVAGGADAILVPEIPFDINIVCDKILALQEAGRRYSLVVVAEGAHPIDGEQEYIFHGDPMSQARLGGIGYLVGNAIADCLEAEVRVTRLGHVQRGGQPTPRDRWLATRFGSAAVHFVAQERWGHMVALRGTKLIAAPMQDAAKINRVNPDGEMVRMARHLGIVFG